MLLSREHAIDGLGYMGALLLAFLFIPQVWKVYKRRDMKGLTASFLIIQLLAGIDFLLYGILSNSLPIIISNISTLVCILLLIYAKIAFRKGKGGVATEDGDAEEQRIVALPC